MALTILGRRYHPRPFLRQLKVALGVLTGDETVERRLLTRVLDYPDLAEKLEALKNDVPQAVMVDTSLTVVERRDWRTHCTSRLSGHGLEIGPLHRPLKLPPTATVDYIDRHTVEELRRQYFQLDQYDFVEPTLVGDAETLDVVANATYDFVVAAHVIEHMRSPIRALENWCRVTRPGGLVYLVVPDKRRIFDRGRVRTTLEHLILDYEAPSRERDFDHFLDYATRVHGKQAHEALTEARHLADTDYSIHFHVFMPMDLVRLVEWFGAHVRPVAIVEGPVMSPDDDEFHLLLRVQDSGASSS